MSEDLKYNSLGGELATPVSSRLYRSTCGGVGKIVRTKTSGRIVHKFGERTVRYFVWDEPDSAPEYEKESDAIHFANARLTVNRLDQQ